MSQPQILVNQISFTLPAGESLFNELNFSILKHKIGLIGQNGIGKSTLIKLIVGELIASKGSIDVIGEIAYVPQNPKISSETTIAKVLGIKEKLEALNRISNGSVDEKDFIILDDDWLIRERICTQLDGFGLKIKSLNQKVDKLSGGEITRLFLAKTFLSNADFLLLDEPTNHLDYTTSVRGFLNFLYFRHLLFQ